MNLLLNLNFLLEMQIFTFLTKVSEVFQNVETRSSPSGKYSFIILILFTGLPRNDEKNGIYSTIFSPFFFDSLQL